MNQAELRAMADERIRDAEALLAAGRWPFAYYVAGYAVECALKSCVLAQMVNTGWVFKDGVKVADCRTHDFDELLGIAGVRDRMYAHGRANKAAGGVYLDNWNVVSQWRETSRYDHGTTEAQARALLAAITHDPDGVLRWVQGHW